MKKIFVLMTVFALAAVAFVGCNGAPYEKRIFAAEENVAKVFIEARDRRLEIATGDYDFLTVECYENEKEYYIAEEKDGVFSLKLAYNKEWSDYIGAGGDRDKQVIRLYLPQTASLDVLSVSTTGRDIVLGNVSAGEISLNANNGDVSLGKVFVKKSLSAAAKNGNITGNVVGSYDVFQMNIAVKKGKSNLMSKSGGEKLLNISVNNGDINISFTA